MPRLFFWIAALAVVGGVSFFLFSNQGFREIGATQNQKKAVKIGEAKDSDVVILPQASTDSSITLEAPSQELLAIQQQGQLPDSIVVKVHNVEFNLEVADSADIQMKGLTGRESIPDNSGMLYVLTAPVQYKYWAKDMKFATDVIWIGPDRVVKDIFEDIRPDSYPKQYVSEQAALYVLELKSGAVAQAGIRAGDSIDLSELFSLK